MISTIPACEQTRLIRGTDITTTMQSSSSTATPRQQKLAKYFDQVLYGQQVLRISADGHRFLEGLCSQPSPSECIEKLIASPAGLDRLAQAVRQDVTPKSINNVHADLLRYLQEPRIDQLCGGNFLDQIVDRIVRPPTVWDALLRLHDHGMLEASATQAFAWLLLRLLQRSTGSLHDLEPVARRIVENESLLKSGSAEVRVLGQKVKQAFLILTSATAEKSSFQAGGRHDNDFADFRQILILPTPDELFSQDDPFLRQASTICEVGVDQRPAVHLDNQFRLLREDMLGELRKEVELFTSKGSRKPRGFALKNLNLVGADCGTEDRRKKLGLIFRCQNDLPQLRKLSPEKRAKVVAEDKSFLKHQSLGCLFSGSKIVAFATLERNEALMVLRPACIVLQFMDGVDLQRTLLAVKTDTPLRFLQVNTSVFAYEPILKCLQAKREFDFADELLKDESSTASPSESMIQPKRMVRALQTDPNQELRQLVGLKKSIILDDSQAESLLNGLTRKVSLIQGPPGMSQEAAVGMSIY